jgi:pyridoxine 4-dehydrogenase
VTDYATVQRIARELGATAGQIGLAWLLQRAPNIMVIPGTRDPAHLAENVAAGKVRLSDEMIAALDRVTEVSPGP